MCLMKQHLNREVQDAVFEDFIKYADRSYDLASLLGSSSWTFLDAV